MESRINDVIRAQAVARGIILVDAANMLSGEHENFADFGHFTDRGAHALAAAIADAMCSSAEVHRIQRDAPPIGDTTDGQIRLSRFSARQINIL